MTTVASFALYRITSNQMQFARATLPTEKVVLASHDLELGAIIRDDDIVLKDC